MIGFKLKIDYPNLLRVTLLGILLLLPWLITYAENDNIVITGKVVNARNKKKIENASISIQGSNIATVSNGDGYFSLKLPAESLQNGLKVEQIGYQSKIIEASEIEKSNNKLVISLLPNVKDLKEVVVFGGDPREIVKLALHKIPDNYSNKDNLFEGFYRETIQKGNRFINISEAMVDVLKKPYNSRSIIGDKVSIHRGRSLMSPRPSDTLAVKLAGGPYMPIVFDAVKNGEHLFYEEEMENFDFKAEKPVMIDDRMHHVISFKPRVELLYPLNSGMLFIDGETLSFSRIEFQLDMKDKNKVTRSILRKKPSGLHFIPQEVSGVVTYKFIDGKSYINYISSKLRFKCDWKKRLFSSGYTSHAEMVMVDRNDSPDKHIKFEETFNQRKVFSDLVDKYWEEDFWKDYNIIEPTESLEKAVDKLKK